MENIIVSLENIAQAARKSSMQDAQKELKAARELIKRSNDRNLDILDGELATWQTKLEVIFREPVGRNGMAKHAQHWIEQLKK